MIRRSTSARRAQLAAHLGRHGHPEVADQIRHRQLEWLDALPAHEQTVPGAMLSRGLALMRLGRNEEALPWVRRAAEAAPNNLQFAGFHGGLLARLGGWNVASLVHMETIFDDAIAGHPGLGVIVAHARR